MKKLSVIIVTYLNLEIVINCINSIEKYNDIGNQLEIIVVDNSPNKKIYNYIENNYKNIKILKNENNGFGDANNRGAEIASGEYLLFLNPDTIIIEPIFQFAIDRFTENNRLALFGMKLIDGDRKPNLSFYILNKAGILISLITKIVNKFDLYIDGIMFVSGANLFIRNCVFCEIGGFDSKIFMYNEEADIINRIKFMSTCKKTKYFKSKRIVHLEGKSTTFFNLEKKKRMIESKHYYYEKYHLNFNQYIKKQIRLIKIKIVIAKILHDNDYKQKEEELELYKNSLKK